QDVLLDVQPGQTRVVTLTVTPPADLPADGDPIVDVEAFVDGELIGGFRKIFRPPVPVHRPRDPVYAESEIGVDPYPAIPGQPTKLSVEVFNPTDQDRIVTVTFSIANFGIGLPFGTANIAPNPIHIFVPKFGAATGHVIWTPPDFGGHFCVRVTLEMEGHEPIWSQRNIDVGEPLRPGEPHARTFLVGAGPYTGPVTVNLGLRVHRDGWGVALSQDALPNVVSDQPVEVTLVVTPPVGIELGTGEPIVDVEAFVEGELIGGFRKLDRPPVPIHKPHEKSYAESEIMVEPYPPQVDVDSLVSTVIQNASDVTQTINLEFGWADFGMGIPFTTTGMVPYTRSVTLAPEMTQTASVTWTPAQAGHQCVQVWLTDPSGVYEPQRSQRNVDVAERPPCGQTRVFTFTVYNGTSASVTVYVGMITFNVPAEWQITVTPSPTLELNPWSEGVITVEVLIPCPPLTRALFDAYAIDAIQQAAGSVPTIDVESYISGTLVGGIEIQFVGEAAEAGVDLSPGYAQEAQADTVVHYTHILTNTGTTTDTITLEATSLQGWNVMVSTDFQGQPSILPVQMGSMMTATVNVSVTVPTGVVSGTVDTTVITATAQSDILAFDMATDVTTVISEGMQYVYLPLVLRSW
ncbi:MAG: hypothetical protein JXR84_14235, partial [Anaerolineae bacterium]|nr:hypothetical protein [Anaerolineae bacterium]